MATKANERLENIDVAIIGGGPAGRNAATVLARMTRRVAVFETDTHRNQYSHGMHNFPSRDGMLPTEFLAITEKELQHYGVPLVREEVISVQNAGSHFAVKTAVRKVAARKVIFATGVTDTIPEIPGMQELWGADVHHCPFCDGWECKDVPMGLYAKNENGYGMTISIRCLSDNITVFTDGARNIRGVQAAQLAKRGICIVTEKLSHLVISDGKLVGVATASGAIHPVEKLFVNNGFTVNSGLAKSLGCRTSATGAIVTNRKQQTSVPGVYAAGDVDKDVHFVVVAAAEGAKAGVAIHSELLEEDNAFALRYREKK